MIIFDLIKEEKSIKIFIFLIFLCIIFSIFISPVFIFVFLYKNHLLYINPYLLALIILTFSSILFTYIYIVNLCKINSIHKKNKNFKSSESKIKLIITCISRSIITMFVMAIGVSIPISKYIFINGTSINVTNVFLGIIIVTDLVSFIFKVIQNDNHYNEDTKKENHLSKKIEDISNIDIEDVKSNE